MAYKVGDQPIEGYTLEAILGTGQLGDTWKAIGPEGQPCALKIMNLSGVLPQDMRFPRALLNLKHPNIAPIFGAWILDSNGAVLTDGSVESISITGKMNARLILAVELANRSLQDRLNECRSRGIPIVELMNYLDDAARGLDFLHQPDGAKPATIHGNVKPENLLLHGNRVQVSDYGLARLDLTKGATKTFATGSVFFNSPESINSNVVPSSDQYSLAITYYLLRTAQLPFEESKALISNLTGVLDFSLLSDAEIRVLEKATHKHPDQRYPTCSAFAAALRAVVERTAEWQREGGSSSSPPVTSSPSVLPPPPPPRPVSKPGPSLPISMPAVRSTGSFSDDAEAHEASRPPSRPTTPPAKPKSPPPVLPPTSARGTATFADEELPLPSSGAWKTSDKPRSASLPSFSSSADTGSVPRSSSSQSSSVEGQTTVRYYSVMNPDKLFPLMVAFSERQLKELPLAAVKQAVSGPMKVERDSVLVVEPILPGCDVYPPVANLDLGSSDSSWSHDKEPHARFYVVPRVLGRIDEARVIVRKNGQILAEIPLSMKVRRPRLGYVFSALGLLSPLAMSSLKSLANDPEKLKQLDFAIYSNAASWFTQNIPAEYVLGVFLALASVVFLLAWPRRKQSFWSLEKAA